MALYEGKVSIFNSKNGPSIGKDASGEYDSTVATELFDKLIELNQGASVYTLWLDGQTVKGVNNKYSTAQLKKFRKECSLIELVHVRRPFPQPKLKITFGEGSAPTKANRAKLA